MRITPVKIYVHAHSLKIISMIIIFWCLFFAPTFAATTDGSLTALKDRLHTAISLCSRWWVILAVLAGKLMTNDFVYGAFMHMDIYLWKIWNIVKNFANFGLIGLVLRSVIKSMTGKEALDVKKVIIRTLAAGVLIQASWFLVGAVIDISTVATSAIGSFSTTFFQENADLQQMINTSLTEIRNKRMIITLHEWDTQVETIDNPVTTTSTPTDDRSNILPSYNSISGPFIFLGMGVFKFQQWIGTEWITDMPSLTLSFMLRFVVLAMFTFGLLLLFIANIMRVWLLWIFIVGAPLLVLIQVFSLKTDSKWFGKLFSLSNFLWLVFKPLIFVAWISLMLIVVLSMRNTMQDTASWENNLQGISLSTSENTSTLGIEGITHIEASQQNLFGPDVLATGQNLFSTLIVFLLTTFLIRWFIKLSLTLGGWPLQKPMEAITSRAEWLAKTTPILPSGVSWTGIKAFRDKNLTHIAHGLGLENFTTGEFGWVDANGNFQTNSSKFADWMWQKYLWELPARTPADYKRLKNLATAWNITDFFTTSQSLAEQRSGWLNILNNTEWMKYLQMLLVNSTTATSMNFEWSLPWVTEPELKTYFNNTKNSKALYDAMWWSNATTLPSPKNYEDLKKIVFYPSK